MEDGKSDIISISVRCERCKGRRWELWADGEEPAFQLLICCNCGWTHEIQLEGMSEGAPLLEWIEPMPKGLYEAEVTRIMREQET